MDEGSAMQFPIDVILDVVCPWCFIGKRRLDRARSSPLRSIPTSCRWSAGTRSN